MSNSLTTIKPAPQATNDGAELIGEFEAIIDPSLAKYADQSPEFWLGYIEGLRKRFNLPNQ